MFSRTIGTRLVVMIGGILATVGSLLCSFANSVDVLIICYGMVSGLTIIILPLDLWDVLETLWLDNADLLRVDNGYWIRLDDSYFDRICLGYVLPAF